MISTDDLERMLVEIMTGQPPSLHGEEADQVRAQLQKECNEIAQRGGTVEIPGEIPEASEDGGSKQWMGRSVDDVDTFGAALLLKAIQAGLYEN